MYLYRKLHILWGFFPSETNTFFSSYRECNTLFLWFLGYQKQKSTEVIIIKDTSTYPNLIVVSFRGTDPFDADDWCTDFDLSW